ncbi:DUF2062 domain-containing protein [bacterium]|nr:DUF2062 domain-containing protein [bacterium]
MKEVSGHMYNKLKTLLKLNDSPEWIALSFSIGIFVGFTPLYGLHTLSAILLFTLFRFNKLAILIGSTFNLPWIAPFIYFAGYYLGEQIWLASPFFAHHQLFEKADFIRFFSSWGQFKTIFYPTHFLKIFLPTLLGTTLLGIAAGGMSYFLLKASVIRYRRLKEIRRYHIEHQYKSGLTKPLTDSDQTVIQSDFHDIAIPFDNSE